MHALFVYLIQEIDIVSQQSELCIFRCAASAAHFLIYGIFPDTRKEELILMNIKKTLAAALAAAMALSMTACSGRENQPAPSTKNNAETSGTTEKTKDEAETKPQLKIVLYKILETNQGITLIFKCDTLIDFLSQHRLHLYPLHSDSQCFLNLIEIPHNRSRFFKAIVLSERHKIIVAKIHKRPDIFSRA